MQRMHIRKLLLTYEIIIVREIPNDSWDFMSHAIADDNSRHSWREHSRLVPEEDRVWSKAS